MNEDAPKAAAETIKSASTGGIVFGAIFLLLGICSIALPLATGMAIAAIVAGMLIFAGLLRVVAAWRAKSGGHHGWFGVLLGLLTAACGVVMFVKPLVALATLTLVIAIYFLSDGLLSVIAALANRAAPRWGWVLLDGIVSIVLGILIWSEWPLSGGWAIGILVGVRLVMLGTATIALGGAVRASLASDK